ncbi:voltage-gated chloride channel family protein [Clostridium brassicae]|uniref:Voltage-gated chloride channel family protein n=1 Tax=Clostridium brassicae TaxID=2999072 RepID=A0ABT4DED6_9CLOT|nr:voltage-gated chloride channel family protein [Clostridium brassicae]MCY6960674.1 voltage-gated chloride channel family protein [Clostridium brassicae]
MKKILANYTNKDFKHFNAIIFFTKWLILASLVAIPSGILSAFFLVSLSKVTNFRELHPNIIFLLPLGGALVSYIYMVWGKNSSKGNNLIIEQVERGIEKEEPVPSRLAFLTLFGTITTHLFGGSAGREGTAIQMGGSMADTVARLLKINKQDRQILLLCGISSGFSSVFGTPLAGTVFAMEVISIGKLHSYAFIPCFISAFVSNEICLALGATHSHYQMIQIPQMSFVILLKIIIASICFGLGSILFSELTYFFKESFSKITKNQAYKSFIGGIIIIILVFIFNTRDYLGLGLPMIDKALKEPVSLTTFFLKTLFTSITLGAGYQGGEVTPLFFIGSTLGNALGQILNISPYFLASLGFVALFAGATNTPLACFIMGLELFHGQGIPFLFISCMISYLFSGHHGIYSSQTICAPKYSWLTLPENSTLLSLKTKRSK